MTEDKTIIIKQYKKQHIYAECAHEIDNNWLPSNPVIKSQMSISTKYEYFPLPQDLQDLYKQYAEKHNEVNKLYGLHSVNWCPDLFFDKNEKAQDFLSLKMDYVYKKIKKQSDVMGQIILHNNIVQAMISYTIYGKRVPIPIVHENDFSKFRRILIKPLYFKDCYSKLDDNEKMLFKRNFKEYCHD